MSSTEDIGDQRWMAARDQGIRLLENQDHPEALNALKDAIAGDPSRDSLAFLALAHFQLEEYDLAANHYEAALKHNPDNQEWKEMLGSAKANAVATNHATHLAHRRGVG